MSCSLGDIVVEDAGILEQTAVLVLVLAQHSDDSTLAENSFLISFDDRLLS